jgi:hypothetical protein
MGINYAQRLKEKDWGLTQNLELLRKESPSFL